MKKLFSLFIALLGNFIEYYEYALYGFLAPLIAKVFFPSENEITSLIEAFGVFALGSFAKPLGGYIFGRLGDRQGRKKALQYNMLGIAIVTALMGLLPGFSTWGVTAPLLLILLRVLQGVFLGGEIDGIRIYVLEHVSKKHPCFANSLSSFTSSMGVSFASFMASLMASSTLGPDWAWRLPLLIGAGMAFVLYFLRHFLKESPIFLNSSKKQAKTLSTWQAIKENRLIFIAIFCMGGSIGGMYYFFLVFGSTFFGKLLKIAPPETVSLMFSRALLLYTALVPLVGLLADRVHKETILLLGIFALFILSGTAILLDADMLFSWTSLALLTFALSCFNVPAYVLLIEKVPPFARYQLFSIGHSLGALAFSSSAPMIGSYLWKLSEMDWVPLLYPVLLCLMGMAGFYCIKAAPRLPKHP